MNTTIMNTVSDEYIGRAFTIWASLSLLIQSVVSPLLGKGINEFGETIGFNIILGTSFIIILILILINSSKTIFYNHEKEE